MAVRPAPNPSDNVNAPLNACPWDRQAARRHARTVHPARSVPPAVPTPTAPVYCAPSLRSSAATAAGVLTAGPHRLASPPGSLLCSSSAAPFPLGDGVVGTTHSQAGREPPLPIQISTFGGTLPGRAPIEDPDVVETEEATLEYVLPEAVLAIHPPSEVQQKLLKSSLEEIDISLAPQGLLCSMEKQGRPSVDWRVDIAEVPLICRNLAAGVHVKPFEHEIDLLLGELGVHDRYRDRVEREVPGRIPGIFPFVGHRDDVVVEHVEPFLVPEVPASGNQRVGAMVVQPLIRVQVVVLLTPQHAS